MCDVLEPSVATWFQTSQHLSPTGPVYRDNLVLVKNAIFTHRFIQYSCYQWLTLS